MPHSRIEKNVRIITSHFHREKLEQSFKFEGDRFAGTDGAASNTMRVERHQSRNEGLKVHSHPVLERVDVRYDFAPCCRIVTIAPWRPAVLAGRAEPVQIRQVHRALPLQPDSVPTWVRRRCSARQGPICIFAVIRLAPRILSLSDEAACNQSNTRE